MAVGLLFHSLVYCDVWERAQHVIMLSLQDTDV